MSERHDADDQIEERAKMQGITALVTLRDAAKNRGADDEVRRLDALIDEISGAAPQVERTFRIDAPKVDPPEADAAELRKVAARVLPPDRRLDSTSVRDIALAVFTRLAAPLGITIDQLGDGRTPASARTDAYLCGAALEMHRLSSGEFRSGRSRADAARRQMIEEQDSAWQKPIGVTAADFEQGSSTKEQP